MNRLDTTDTDHVSLPDTTVGRARAVLAGAGLILGLAAAGLLGATQAVAATPTFAVTASPYLNEHSGPSTADATVGTIAHGLKVTISCQTTGSTYFG
ncbi:MAG: hypothetical protein ABI345_11365, partial [Jatrophihabitans sp.]